MDGVRPRQERPGHCTVWRRVVWSRRTALLALVPDVSLATPGDFLTQQQIPWFGPGYDATYCPDKGVKGFGFSTYGCILRLDATKAYGKIPSSC